MLHTNSFTRSFSFLIVIISLLFATNNRAQEHKVNDFGITENAIVNLNTAIKSDNPGLRRSAIHLAGKYLLEESAENLLEQLKNEDDKCNRIMIVKSLYLIGNDEFMDDIYLVAKKDKDLNVREYAYSLYSMMKLEKSVNLANVNK